MRGKEEKGRETRVWSPEKSSLNLVHGAKRSGHSTINKPQSGPTLKKGGWVFLTPYLLVRWPAPHVCFLWGVFEDLPKHHQARQLM